MKRFDPRYAGVALLLATALGCRDSRPSIPTAASMFIPGVQGVWSGPMTLQGTSGGECVAGVVPSFLPTLDQGTVTLAQNDEALVATLTMESTGLACKYTGTTSGASLAMNATSCDRTGLVIRCVENVARELRLVGSSVTAVWNGDQLTGRTTTTYNVFTPDGQQGVGSLVAAHSFTATRQ